MFLTNLYAKSHCSAPSAHHPSYIKPNSDFAQPLHILHFTEKLPYQNLHIFQKSITDSELEDHRPIPGSSKDFPLCHFA
jgi:hypothetical protein